MEGIGDGAVGLRIYKRSEEGLLSLLSEMSSASIQQPFEGRSYLNDVGTLSSGNSGLYCVFIQGGVVQDVACLCFLGGQMGNSEEQEMLDISSSGESQKEKDEDDNGTVEVWGPGVTMAALLGHEEEEEEDDNDGHAVEAWRPGVVSMPSWWRRGGEEEEEGDDDDDGQVVEAWRPGVVSVPSWWRRGGEEEEEEEEKKEEAEEEKAPSYCRLQIKIWIPQERFLVKIHRGGRWVLTKEYHMMWLQAEEVEKLLGKNSFVIGSIVSRNSTWFLEYDNTVDLPLHYELLEDVMQSSTKDFIMLERVGGEEDCMVLKCLFSGRICALKAISQDEPVVHEPREVDIISTLKDAHVMIFYQAWVESWSYKKHPEKIYLFMHLEFCPRTLETYLVPHRIENSWWTFEQIVRGVKYIHGGLVVHRDLKPDNIFFSSDGVIRIGDFGDACIGHDEFGRYGGTPGCGTTSYLAPELDSDEKVTEKIFAKFRTGSERCGVFQTLRDEGPPADWNGNIELFRKMTAMEPSDRFSANDVLEYIEELAPPTLSD